MLCSPAAISQKPILDVVAPYTFSFQQDGLAAQIADAHVEPEVTVTADGAADLLFEIAGNRVVREQYAVP